MLNSTSDFLAEPIYRQRDAGIKIATPDILLNTDRLSINTMEEYTFASISGIELLSVSRHDLIDSPLNNEYTPVVDAGTRFSSTIEIPVTDGSNSVFRSFEIDISKHIVYDAANTVSVQHNTYTVTAANISSNVVNVTSINHKLKIGDSVVISNVNSTINGTRLITNVATNYFTFNLIASNATNTNLNGLAVNVDGQIVIQLKNLKPNYYVEVEIFSNVVPTSVII